VNVSEKRRIVEQLTERMRGCETMIVADFRGLTVGQVADVRSQLREAGATFHVAKNTLARIAAAQAEKPSLVELLEGPTAIAFVADDPAVAAKKLADIARQTRVLTVRGAVMEGQALSADDVRQLAELPPRDVLRAQVIGAVASPVQGAYNVLAAPLREFLVVLDQYIQKREAEEAAEIE
jgi:large subunit ribosomal protein L10